jgi:hypothetical protein
MFKNRFLLVLSLISLLSVTLAVSYARPDAPRSVDQGPSDFYQRHPDWAWTVRSGNTVGSAELSDYFQRHPELISPAKSNVDLTDYYFRHPELIPAAKTIDHIAASKYEDRYDRMNVLPDADGLYNASKYEDRYDRMNDLP